MYTLILFTLHYEIKITIHISALIEHSSVNSPISECANKQYTGIYDPCLDTRPAIGDA
jgi:hypothetical protein